MPWSLSDLVEAGVDLGIADEGALPWPKANSFEAGFVSLVEPGGSDKAVILRPTGDRRVSEVDLETGGAAGWRFGFSGETERGLTSMGETSPSGRCCVMTSCRS